MANIFLCSDHHLGHHGMLKFLRSDGITPLRSFNDVDHMNEHIIAQHNKVVSPSDKVYFVGDIAMSGKYLPLLRRMNGEKVLIKGNHDQEKLSVYHKYFKDVRGSHQLDGMLLTHIPIHPNSLSRWRINIHGHLHSNVVTIGDTQVPDDRYFSVCMERLDDYTPISLEDIKKACKKVLEIPMEKRYN